MLERTVGDPETDHRELHTSFERALTYESSDVSLLIR